jgi:hemolysin D
MNARTPPPPARIAKSAIVKMTRRDREFLPAAIEILETPPPPLPVAMMLAICAFFALAFAWSFFGRLDVDAVAPGKIETAGRAKVVQPLDSGKVLAIHVENGARVHAGDLLIEMDPAEAAADEAAQRDAADASRAEAARRRFAIEQTRAAMELLTKSEDSHGAQALALLEQAALAIDPPIAWDETASAEARKRERSVLAADLNQLVDSLQALDKQMAQKEATVKRLNMSIAFQNALMQTLTDRVSTRQEAIDLRVGTKINLYDAKEELQKAQSALASDQGELIETDAALKELISEKAKTLAQFVADNENKAADAARKADEAKEAAAKASARLARTKLYSPIDGVVQQMAVTTVGQVVTTGQQLLVVAPIGEALQVDALVANIDIGFVKPGQDAVIKVDAFPFTRFGVLHGKVARIASEAIDEQEAKRALANATAAANVANMSGTTAPGQPQSFVFPVTLTLDANVIQTDGAAVPLASGMTVSVEIKTDSRRVIDYLISPIAKVASEAMRER